MASSSTEVKEKSVQLVETWKFDKKQKINQIQDDEKDNCTREKASVIATIIIENSFISFFYQAYSTITFYSCGMLTKRVYVNINQYIEDLNLFANFAPHADSIYDTIEKMNNRIVEVYQKYCDSKETITEFFTNLSSLLENNMGTENPLVFRPTIEYLSKKMLLGEKFTFSLSPPEKDYLQSDIGKSFLEDISEYKKICEPIFLKEEIDEIFSVENKYYKKMLKSIKIIDQLKDYKMLTSEYINKKTHTFITKYLKKSAFAKYFEDINTQEIDHFYYLKKYLINKKKSTKDNKTFQYINILLLNICLEEHKLEKMNYPKYPRIESLSFDIKRTSFNVNLRNLILTKYSGTVETIFNFLCDKEIILASEKHLYINNTFLLFSNILKHKQEAIDALETRRDELDRSAQALLRSAESYKEKAQKKKKTKTKSQSKKSVKNTQMNGKIGEIFTNLFQQQTIDIKQLDKKIKFLKNCPKEITQQMDLFIKAHNAYESLKKLCPILPRRR